MNGPAHFLEAERLLAVAMEGLRLAATGDFADAPPPSSIQISVSLAQVHATLAHTAASVAAARPGDSRVSLEWAEVLR